MSEITKAEMLDRMGELIPDLLEMRRKIDNVIVDIKLFRSTRVESRDKSKVNIITKIIPEYFGIKMSDITGRSRESEFVKARHIYCAMVKGMTGLPFTKVGELVNRDHTTVIHSCKVMQDARDTKDVLWDHYGLIQEKVEETVNALI